MAKKVAKSIRLKFTNYIIKGTTFLTLWVGGESSIEMDPFEVDNISEETLLANINDAGFGVQSINGALCHIYCNYEGYERYFGFTKVGKIPDNYEEFFD